MSSWGPTLHGVSSGHGPRLRGQRVLFKMSRNCCWALCPFFLYPRFRNKREGVSTLPDEKF
eukprot:8223847-Pyramimonas_sp.AAC.1